MKLQQSPPPLQDVTMLPLSSEYTSHLVHSFDSSASQLNCVSSTVKSTTPSGISIPLSSLSHWVPSLKDSPAVIVFGASVSVSLEAASPGTSLLEISLLSSAASLSGAAAPSRTPYAVMLLAVPSPLILRELSIVYSLPSAIKYILAMPLPLRVPLRLIDVMFPLCTGFHM